MGEKIYVIGLAITAIGLVGTLYHDVTQVSTSEMLLRSIWWRRTMVVGVTLVLVGIVTAMLGK